MKLTEARQILKKNGYLLEYFDQQGGYDSESIDDLYPNIKDFAEELGYHCDRDKNFVYIFTDQNIDETFYYQKLINGLEEMLAYGANQDYYFQLTDSDPIALKVKCGFVHINDEDLK